MSKSEDPDEREIEELENREEEESLWFADLLEDDMGEEPQ